MKNFILFFLLIFFFTESLFAESPKTSSPVKTDENLVIFASDMHLIKKAELRVASKGEKGIHQRYYSKLQPGEWLIEYDTKENFRIFIRQILAMNPRPAAVVLLGDIGSDYDQAIYQEYRSMLQPLSDAGIPYWNIIGNHDHFDNYYAVFPEEKEKSIVSAERWGSFRIELPEIDLVLMETFAPKRGDREGPFDRFFSSKENEFYEKNPSHYIYEGWFTPDQRKWLKEQLTKDSKKPVFVCGHHPIQMDFVFPEHVQYSNFQGWICGHYHIFSQNVRSGSNRSLLLPGLGVPGIGWNLDPPGYVKMKIGPNTYQFQYCTLDPSQPQNGKTYKFPVLK